MNTQSNVQSEQKGFLKWVESVGNHLPHPMMLFIYLAVSLMILSAIMAYLHVSVMNEATGKPVVVKNLLSREGIHWILLNMVDNFAHFKPLGAVLTLCLGMGLAEQTGLIQAVVRKIVSAVPKKYITIAVVFIGFLGHYGGDASFLVLPAIGAMVFYAFGRHPFVGFAATLAAMLSGLTANFFCGNQDVLLGGITTDVLKKMGSDITVSPLDNWYFMLFSVLFLMFLVYWITEHIVEPKWGRYDGTPEEGKNTKFEPLTEQERKALRWSGIAALVFVAVVTLLVAPDGALLRNPKNGSLIGSPFLNGIVPIILFFFLTVAITYGVKVGKITKQRDIPRMMSGAMKELTGFMVMAFGAAQFIAFFGWTNIGQYVAVAGAHYLTSIHVTGYPLLFAFMMLTAVLSFCITSSSGLWVLLAPVFVPMFSMLGYHPAFVQLLYRVPDSAVHPMSPVEPFLPLFLMILGSYKKDVGLGTYFSLMLPYTVIILIFWVTLLSIWYFTGLPIGPGVPIRL